MHGRILSIINVTIPRFIIWKCSTSWLRGKQARKNYKKLKNIYTFSQKEILVLILDDFPETLKESKPSKNQIVNCASGNLKLALTLMKKRILKNNKH